MSDKKISQLTGATTPLAGTEVLPIVQSGSTVKVSVDNLTAGKLVNTGQLTVGTAASPWSFVGSALDTAGNGSIFGGPTLSTVGLFIGTNVYWNGGYKYKVSGQVATEYVQVAGQHIWSTAPFGNANDPITFTQVMNIGTNGNVTANIGDFVVGTAGKGVTTSVTNGNVNLIPNGSGIVASDSGHSFNKIASRRVSKAVAKSGTAVLTVTPVSTTSTHLAVRIDINVAFTNSTNLQYHAGYLVLTCDQTTNGGGTAIAEYYNGTVGNFVVATTDFVVTRPGSGQLVVTYTNNNGADSNNIEFAVTGVFDAATVA